MLPKKKEELLKKIFTLERSFGPVGALRRRLLHRKMALSYHQPHQHCFVGRRKLIFAEKWAVAGSFLINPDDSKG